MPKGTIRQVWVFTCGDCGVKRELSAQSREYAVHMVEMAGGREVGENGWVCPSCSAKRAKA